MNTKPNLDPERLRARAAVLRAAGHDWSADTYEEVAAEVETAALEAALALEVDAGRDG